MRNFKRYFFFFCKVITTLFFATVISSSYAANYTWNGSVSSDWGNPDNWTSTIPGVPGSADNVTINSGTNNVLLDITRSITNFTFSQKTLDLNAMTLTVTGTVTISGGTITGNGNLEMTGAALTITSGLSKLK